MAKIVTVPDPLLHKASEPIVKGEDVGTLIAEMIEAMYEKDGIGLAAVQIGVLKRVVIMETSRRTQMPRVFVNPQIVYRSATTCEMEEGCLSIPGVRYPITRSTDILIAYEDIGGALHHETLTGIDARCMQHEADHLNGILFIDHLSAFKRGRILKKIGR